MSLSKSIENHPFKNIFSGVIELKIICGAGIKNSIIS